MKRIAIFALVAAALAASCGPKVIPAPTVTAPKYPEYIRPRVAPDVASTAAAAGFNRGWLFLQTGDLKNAERELSLALKASPGFSAAEAALGYVELARKDANAALPHFERAV